MYTIGFDLHKRESQLCVMRNAEVVLEQRILTTRDRLTAVLGAYRGARVLLEASTESEWVAQHLEGLGLQVIVADPRYALMYGARSQRVKTDRRDARTLTEALQHGVYRPVHRLSPERRHLRALLLTRDVLVRSRTRMIAVAKTLLRRDGIRMRAGAAESTAERMQALDLPLQLRAELRPLLAAFAPLNTQIAVLDDAITAECHTDSSVQRLRTFPGIGPITACGIVAAIDDITRFASAEQFTAFLGLVPSERSSGEKRLRGHITRTGNPRVRALLVEAGWRVLRSKNPALAPLQQWALRIASRRGKRIAVVALARRIAAICYAMWRDHTAYTSTALTSPTEVVAA
jgi:transposase